MTVYAPIDLPPGVAMTTLLERVNLEWIAQEVEIVHLATDPLTPALGWGRELFFGCEATALGSTAPLAYRPLLLAYSYDASGRIVRGWRLTWRDQRPDSIYRTEPKSPTEAAWLATIAPGKPSEPAWLYLRP
jgi:hypothetical protein